MSEERRIEELIEELVQRLDREPDFSASAFLEAHPEHAQALEAELARLEDIDLGFTSAPEFDAVFGELPPTEDEWSARYELRGELGKGGMGVVHAAYDRELEREVALKVSYSSEQLAGFDGPTRKRVLARFLAEGTVTAQLEHPGIVPVHEAGRMPDGRLYYTMKVVRGETLDEIIEAQRRGDAEALAAYPLSRLVRILASVCEAIEFAHSHGVLHRDLKPQNIMVGGFGEVQVVDWGLAKREDAPGEEHADVQLDQDQAAEPETPFLTLTGDVLGSPKYMAPEQARGDHDVTGPHTDVFGLGTVLYQILTGLPPYSGETYMEVFKNARAHRLADPELLRTVRPVPPELRAICQQALAEQPEERYASVRALANDLTAFLEDLPGSAWRDSAWRRAAKLVRRHPTRALAAGAALLMIALGGEIQVLASGKQRAEQESEQAALREREATFRKALDRMWSSLSFDRGLDLPSAEPIEAATNSGGEPTKLLDAAPRLGGNDLMLRSARRIDEVLQAYEDFGVSVRDEPDLEVLASQLRALPDEDGLRSLALDGLYELAGGMVSQGIAIAYRRTQGLPTPNHGAHFEPGIERATQLPEDVLALWPKIDSLLERVDELEWRRTLWQEWTQGLLVSGREVDVEALGLTSLDLAPQHKAFAGNLVRSFNRRDLARQLLDEAAAEAPNLIQVRVHRVDMFAMVGDLDRAVEEALAAVALVPDSAFYRDALAYMLAERGRGGPEGEDVRRAAEQYRRSIELNPRSAFAYQGLGQSCRRVVPEEEMLALHELGVSLNPDNSHLVANLVLLRTNDDRPEEALALADDYLERHPEDLPVLSKKVYALQGMSAATKDHTWFEEAERTVELMESIDPEDEWFTQLSRRSITAIEDVKRKSGILIEGLIPGMKPKVK